jgi:Domain of unknown function (DUF222)/HNH endonuclease
VPDVVTGLVGRFSFSVTWILAAAIAIAAGGLFLVLPFSNARIDPMLGAGAAAVGLVLFTLAAILLGVTMTTVSTGLYQILEGYLWWPVSWRHARIKRHRAKRQQLVDCVERLEGKPKSEITDLEVDILYQKLSRYPSDEGQIAPTVFGNAMRAFEMYGRDRYELDSQTLWVELFAVVPKGLQAEVAGSRVGIDFFVATVYLSYLYGSIALALASWELGFDHHRSPVLLIQAAVGFQHTALMTRVLDEAPAEVAAEAEPALVEVARRVDPHRLGMLTRHLRHTFAPEAVLQDAEHNHERRRLHLSESWEGLYFIDGVLDTEGGALLRTALDALMGPRSGDDDRTAAQRRADALTDLARRQLDGGELPQVGGQRPHLTLTADIATLARLPGSRAADLDWGQPVPAETLRRIACDASLTCVLVSADGEPLSVGRARRTFTASQRRALVLRDKGCVLCGRPAAWCSGHHLVHWIDGGETSVRNGALLCHVCHRRVHEGRFRLVRTPDGTWASVRDPRPP